MAFSPLIGAIFEKYRSSLSYVYSDIDGWAAGRCIYPTRWHGSHIATAVPKTWHNKCRRPKSGVNPSSNVTIILSMLPSNESVLGALVVRQTLAKYLGSEAARKARTTYYLSILIAARAKKR